MLITGNQFVRIFTHHIPYYNLISLGHHVGASRVSPRFFMPGIRPGMKEETDQ